MTLVYQNDATAVPGATTLVINTGVHSVSIGNTLFIPIQIFWSGGTPALVTTVVTTTGGASDVWSISGPTQNTTGGVFQFLQCQPTTAGARTVTVTIPNATNTFGAQGVIAEFTGLWTLDTGATGGGVVGVGDSGSTSVTWVTPSLTPSAAGDLIIGQSEGNSVSQSSVPTVAGGFTNFTSIPNNANPVAYLIGATSSAQQATWTAGNADIWSAAAAAYKPSATAGTASETTTFTGVGVGAVKVAATASETATFTAVAAGAVSALAGTAALTATFTGTATGAVKVAGTASTTATFTGAGVGAINVAGTAAETTTFTGSGVGAIGLVATASETATFTGTAVGTFTSGGQTANFVGTAVGVVNATAGTASETVTFTGTATSAVGAPGTASTTATYTGAATSAITLPSTAATTITFTGTAVGASSSGASGTGALTATFTGTTTGAITTTATASETATLTAIAVGSVNGSGATTTRPTFNDWRTTSSTADGLNLQTIPERIRAALASCVSGQNPDGTTIT